MTTTEPGSMPHRRIDPRVARSRRAILEASTELFLRDGYVMTTMDAIAVEAGVSKRTVYNNFADKEALFREVVLAVSSVAEHFATTAATVLSDPDDLRRRLTDLATQLAVVVTSPPVVRLRRLIIGEAQRFPDLAAAYYRAAPGAVLAMLADAFCRLDERGKLRVDDPELAAEHFAYLVVGASLDRAVFDGHDTEPDPTALAARAVAGAAVFLARYGS